MNQKQKETLAECFSDLATALQQEDAKEMRNWIAYAIQDLGDFIGNDSGIDV